MTLTASSSTSINFLPRDVFISEAEINRRRSVLIGTIITLTVYLTALASLFAITFFFSSKKNELQAQIDDTENQISKLRQTEIYNYTIVDRVQKLTPLLDPLAQNKDLVQTVFKIKQAFPAQIAIESISAKKQKISVPLKLDNPDLIDQMVPQFESLARELGLTQIKLSGLSKNTTTGSFTSSIEFTAAQVTPPPPPSSTQAPSDTSKTDQELEGQL